MKVGIIQSNYIPFRGYFDFIRECDAFVLHDDLQYTKRDYRNRNRIKTPQGLRWLTVPVHYKHTGQLIQDTHIDYSKPWIQDHANMFMANYMDAPYMADAMRLLALTTGQPRTISSLNRTLLEQAHARFCTLACAQLVPEAGGSFRAHLYSAGHPAPVIVRTHSAIQRWALTSTRVWRWWRWRGTLRRSTRRQDGEI